MDELSELVTDVEKFYEFSLGARLNPRSYTVETRSQNVAILARDALEDMVVGAFDLKPEIHVERTGDGDVVYKIKVMYDKSY
jgi:hypothetical protein